MVESTEFDEEFIKRTENVGKTIKEYGDRIELELKNSTEIELKTRKSLELLNHVSLNALSQLYELSVFNMRLFNEIAHAIDRLPDEFAILKKQFKDNVLLSKKQTNFVHWGVRYTEDLASDLEKIKGKKS